MGLVDLSSHQHVGHPTINEQHKALVDTIMRLEAALKAGQNRREIEEILEFLKDRTKQHFLVDEELFRSLEQLASTDLLTSAWNRRHFQSVVEGEIHRSTRYGHPVSLLLLDIDHFKKVNDTFGHPVGDQVLREVANCIRSTIRLSDSLTRWGGEEFLVLMPNTGLSSSTALAERVRECIATHTFDGIGTVTASIGVAEYISSNSLDQWVDRADRAMYRAKDKGRNQVQADPARNEACSSTEHLEGSFLKLVWSEAYCCGHPTIDSQHRHLFVLANELLDAVISNRPNDETQQSVTNLLSSILEHFHDEEDALDGVKFSGLINHQKKHEALVEKALELQQAFQTGKLSIGSLFQFLAHDVVATHMLKDDREFFSLMGKN